MINKFYTPKIIKQLPTESVFACCDINNSYSGGCIKVYCPKIAISRRLVAVKTPVPTLFTPCLLSWLFETLGKVGDSGDLSHGLPVELVVDLKHQGSGL